MLILTTLIATALSQGLIGGLDITTPKIDIPTVTVNVPTVTVPTVDVPTVTVSIPSISSIVVPTGLPGLGLNLDALKAQIAALGGAGVDAATIMMALKQIDDAKLQIKAADVQTAEAIAMANAQIMVANGQLKLAQDLVLKSNIIAKESLALAAKLTIDASVQVKTQGILALDKANGALELGAKSVVTAAGLVLSESNKVNIAVDAQLSVGLLQAQAGVSTIAGSFEVFSSHLFEVLKGAQVTLAAAAGATGAATVEADIALRDASSQLTIANDIVLKAQSKIAGAGALIVQAKLDAQTALDAALQTSLEAGKLELAAASQLLLKANKDASTLLKVAGEAKLGGKLNVAADAAVKEIVLAYGSRVGTFSDVTVNGEAAVAEGGRKRADAAKWKVSYGATSTKITKQAGDSTNPSGSSSASTLSLAAALVVAPIAAYLAL